MYILTFNLYKCNETELIIILYQLIIIYIYELTLSHNRENKKQLSNVYTIWYI